MKPNKKKKQNMTKIKKCLKCGSYVLEFPCKFCKEELCNSCLLSYSPEMMSKKYPCNCIKCEKKLDKIEHQLKSGMMREVKFFRRSWDGHGIEIFTKKDKDIVTIEKQGNQPKVCDFKIKETLLKDAQ